ncbi:DUF1264-domain-containing protein [Ascobolus immersus RN42]|uniref:DUF1264-domain-containing protein n=1 Tax=Ascobolus immersus RN42 TaxID=1160509 RepID=A0A3N4IE26_ASCIM|nr:DUF1264-domain-containing protein [Ascobolus immersus RN42]
MHFSRIASTLLLAAGAAAHSTMSLGAVGPNNAVLFLNGFHFISGNEGKQLQADHYCALISNDFIQCTIYEPGANPEKLMGVEYIISGDRFAKLPDEEKQLWHSHQYEVKSGLLTQPGLPPMIDHPIMEILVNTYGKTFHTWPSSSMKNDIPIGIPELIFGYTGVTNPDDDFVKSRDEFYGTNTTLIKEQREDIVDPPVIPGADSWKYGYSLQLALSNTTKPNADAAACDKEEGEKEKRDCVNGFMRVDKRGVSHC